MMPISKELEESNYGREEELRDMDRYFTSTEGNGTEVYVHMSRQFSTVPHGSVTCTSCPMFLAAHVTLAESPRLDVVERRSQRPTILPRHGLNDIQRHASSLFASLHLRSGIWS